MLTRNTSTNQKTVQSRLAVALTLSEAGIAVFPCAADKTPLTRSGFKAASSSRRQITEWWKNWPDALIGIPTGSANGISVLDLDFGFKKGKFKSGFRALKNLGYEYASLSSFMQETPSGGAHIYFSHCQGLKSSADKIARGVDVRASGGYVVFYGTMLDALRLTTEIVIGLPEFPEELIPEESEIRRGEDAVLPIDQVQDALNACPNDGDEYSSRDDWLRVGMAVHAATGGSRDGLLAWKEWSRQHDSYNAENTESAWRSFSKKSNGITASTLLAEARKHGWSDICAADFEDDPETDAAEIAEVEAKEKRKSDEERRKDSSFFSSASELDGKPIPKREWLIEGLVPNKQVTVIEGNGGTGKSLIALQLAVACVTGKRWLGQRVDIWHGPETERYTATKGRAVYLGAEDDFDEMHRRMASICHASNIDLSELSGLRFRSLAGEDALLAVSSHSGPLEPTKLYERLSRIMSAERPSLIVLDTLVNLFGGNPVDPGHATAFINMLKAWAIEHECAVVLLAHPSRAGMETKGGSYSVAWHNGVRSWLYLDRVIIDGIEIDDTARTLRQVKSNYSRNAAEISLEFKDGAFRADYSEFDDTPQERAEQAFMRLLSEFAKQNRNCSPNISSAYAPKMMNERQPNISKRQFIDAMNRLLDAEKIRIETIYSRGKESQRLIRVTEFEHDY